MNKDLGFSVTRAGSELGKGEPEEHEPEPGEALVWAQVMLPHVVRQIPRLVHVPEPAPSAEAQALAAAEPQAGGAPEGASSPQLPARLITEVSDERLGRFSLTVTRQTSGLDIVINVADERVKALIMADHDALTKTLQDCGLRVASVQIGGAAELGTALAPQAMGAPALGRTSLTEKPRNAAGQRALNGRWQATYPAAPRDEDSDTKTESIDLTA